MWRCWGSERCPPPMLQDGGFSIHGHTKIQYSSFFWRCNLYVYIYRHVCIYYIYNINTHTHTFYTSLYMEVNKLDPFFFTTSDFRCDGRPCEVGWMIWRQYSEWFGHVSLPLTAIQVWRTILSWILFINRICLGEIKLIFDIGGSQGWVKPRAHH